MKLFGREFGHKNQQDTPRVQNPDADLLADQESEAAFERLEPQQALGKVTINASKAGENNVVELPNPENTESDQVGKNETPTDQQLTA